ncbi:hypothetical protein [Nocardia paucivorans]|uniref:hypothetical protein n=1 Tax=Nocardia paucivorans TaxID=114259 RepID=UPI0002F145B8|nr:hypothetical protein [Nocardia paucivorans]
MIRFLAVLSGALLVGVIALMLPWAAIPAAGLVVAGWWYRYAAVAAILLAVPVLAWSDPGVVAAAATGLVATAYLLNTATATAPVGVVPTSAASVVGALACTVLVGGVVLLPLHIAWGPAVAPVLVIMLYAILTHGIAQRAR